MTFGAEVWGPAAVSALGSIAGGFLSGKSTGPKETKMQKTQRKLVDQLLGSLNGQGPYADLYSPNQETFNKSFVEPAQAMFRNQIAPQIQQQYIASGQQRGTGLDDQLLRAGVDLDSMLNQYMFQNQENALNRKQNTINSILGQGAGAQAPSSNMDLLGASLGGYLTSPGFADTSANIFNKYFPQNNQSTAQPNMPIRKGFAPDWSDYKLGDPRWGQ